MLLSQEGFRSVFFLWYLSPERGKNFMKKNQQQEKGESIRYGICCTQYFKKSNLNVPLFGRIRPLLAAEHVRILAVRVQAHLNYPGKKNARGCIVIR